MHFLREYLRRLWATLRGSPTDPDLELELRFHVEQAEEELRGKGHSPAEAARLARAHLGGLPQAMEALRDQHALPFVRSVGQDVRFGLRVLRRNPLLTLTATLSIALGIGVNSVLFMYADAYMLRPLPVADADAVVTVRASTREGRWQGIAYANYRDLRECLSSFEGLIARQRVSSSFARAQQDSRDMRVGMLVSNNFFDVLGVRPELGRTFGPDEGVAPGRDPVVVLGHDFWATVLGADDTVVDDVVWLNGVAFTVIGVTEESFTGMGAILRPAFYAPAAMAKSLGGDEDLLESRTGGRFGVYGRLRPGVSRQAAHAEVEAQWAGLQREHPDANVGSMLAVRTVRQERIQDDPSAAALFPILMGLAFTVLLIACANVASLLFRWATARSVEVATRMALGGGASRLLRQFLTESLLLALLGTAVGIALAFVTTRLAGNLAGQGDGLPLFIELRMNHRALFFSLALTGVTAVLAGLAPARYGLKTRLVSLLNHARQGEAGRSQALGRSALVVVQVALSMALLVNMSLMMGSIGRSIAADPGYGTDRRLRMTLDTSHTRYGPARTRAFYRQLVDEVRTLPGVTSVALASRLPLDRGAGASVERVIPEGYPLPADREDESVLAAVVDGSYFDTMGTRIRRGRAFDEHDTEQSPRVAVVNERFADVYWPGQNPVGRRLRLNRDSERPWLEVVGVAETGKYRFINEAPTAFVFLPFSQNPRTRMSALVEASTDANAVSLAGPLRDVVRSLDVAQPIFGLQTVSSFFQWRVIAPQLQVLNVVGTMGALGLVLTLVGLYGLVAYSAARRTREIGIRRAMGAGTGRVVWLVMRQGVTLSFAGIVAGGLLGVMSAGLVGSLMAEVERPSPMTFVVVPLALIGLTLGACYLPARRAARMNPAVALRYE